MADILIRGMEMPHGCDDCKLRHRHQGAYCVDYCVPLHTTVDPWTFGRERNGDKPDWCPLLPLPEGHGRLGDLDRLFEVMGQDADRWIVDEVSMIETDDVLDAIQNAPTIVPAEGGTDECSEN